MRAVNRLLILVLLLLLAACGTGTEIPLPTVSISETPPPNPTATPLPTRAPLPTEVIREEFTVPQDPDTTVRVVHAAAETGELNVFLDTQAVATGLRFAQATEPSMVLSGTYQLKAVPGGAGSEVAPLIEQEIVLSADTPLLVLLTRDGDGNLTLMSYVENVEALATESARLTFLNAIPNSDPIGFISRDPEQLVPPLAFSAISEPIVLPAATYTFTVTPLEIPHTITLRERRSHIVIAVGAPDIPTFIEVDIPIQVLSTVTFVNTASEVESIDIYVDNILAQAALSAFADQDGITLPAGIYTVDIYAAGDDPEEIEPLLTRDLRVNIDEGFYAILVGPASELQLVTHRIQEASLNPNEAEITFLNTITTTVREATIDGLTVGFAQPVTTTIEAGPYSFQWLSDSGAVVEQAGEELYRPGFSYLYLITGQPGAEAVLYANQTGVIEDSQLLTLEGGSAYLINTLSEDIQLLVDGISPVGPVGAQSGTDTRFSLEPGERTLTFVQFSTATPLYETTLFVQGGTLYRLYFVADEGEFALETRMDFLIDVPEGTAIQLTNYSGNPQAPLSLGWTTPDNRPEDPAILPEGLQFARGLGVVDNEQTDLFEIPAGTLDLYLYNATSEMLVDTLFDTILQENTLYEAVAAPNGLTLSRVPPS